MHSTSFSRTFLSLLKIHQIKEGGPNFLGEPILENGWIIWSALLYFNFRNLKDPNSLSFIRFQCLLHDSAVLFSGFWNFIKLKRRDLISWGEPILQNNWIIWSPLLYFNFRSSKEPHSFSFIRCQCILHDAVVLFSGFSNFFKLKMWKLNSCGESILQNSSIIWFPLLYFNFRTFKDPNSLSFITFQCVLHDSAVLFSGFWSFLKLKSGDLISWRNQCCRMPELFGPPSCISNLEVGRTQIVFHSLDFNAFYMM